MRLGPFYVTPTILVKDVGVDTNVFNTALDPKSDFTATFAPDVEVFLPVGRAGLSVESVTDLIYFHTFESERSVNTDLVVRGEIPVRRVTLFAEDSYLNTRERPSFEIDLRSRRIENRFDVGVDVTLARKLSLRISGGRSLTEFDGDAVFQDTNLAEALNRDEQIATVSLSYRLTPLTNLVVAGETTETRFRLSPDRDSDSVSVIPGVEFNPRGLISGSAHVGFRHFDAVGADLRDFSGAVASVDLSYRFRESTGIGFTADRDVYYSFEPVEPYYVGTSYGGSVRRQLIGRFGVTVAAQQYKYRYRGLLPGTQQESASRRTDTIRNYSITANIGTALGASLDVDLTYWQRRSNTGDSRNFDGLRVGTGVSYDF
jgi:hypothetical protein